jgi:hypothetical protein
LPNSPPPPLSLTGIRFLTLLDAQQRRGIAPPPSSEPGGVAHGVATPRLLLRRTAASSRWRQDAGQRDTCGGATAPHPALDACGGAADLHLARRASTAAGGTRCPAPLPRRTSAHLSTATVGGIPSITAARRLLLRHGQQCDAGHYRHGLHLFLDAQRCSDFTSKVRRRGGATTSDPITADGMRQQ